MVFLGRPWTIQPSLDGWYLLPSQNRICRHRLLTHTAMRRRAILLRYIRITMEGVRLARRGGMSYDVVIQGMASSSYSIACGTLF